MRTTDRRGAWWRVPAHAAATVAWRLPGALLGVVLFTAAGSMLGPPGLLLAVIWALTGLLTATPWGERAVVRTVLRYRPSPQSWLDAEARRLLPGRRVDVYVAPKASGVFPLGWHTIGLGDASMGTGAPTLALLAETAAAAEELRGGRTWPELPLLWWCVPWWFARQIPGVLLPRRWRPLLTVWAVGVLAAASVNAVHNGRPAFVVMAVLALTDLCIIGVRDRRESRGHRRIPRQLHTACTAAPGGRHSLGPAGLAPGPVAGRVTTSDPNGASRKDW